MKKEKMETTALTAKAEATLDEFEAVCGKAEEICVGLSGGADSTALLLTLDELKEKRGFSLSAIHIDHMLRGEESDRDREFCVSLCEKLSIPLDVRRIDIKAIRNGGTEETARRERYRAFSEKKVVALAHTASDDLETMLFSLVRGTSPDGIGIPLYRKNGDGFVVRPLLYATREETEALCRERGVGVVTDSTNSKTDYTRNYIRKEIVPRLKKVCKDAEGHASAFAELCRRDAEYFDRLLPCDGTRITADESTPDVILRRAVRRAAKNAGARDLDSVHIAAVSDLVRRGKRGDCADIKGAYAIKRRGYTEIVGGKPRTPVRETAPSPVVTGEMVKGDGFEFTAVYDEKVAQYLKSVYNYSIYQTIYDDNIYGSLYLRQRLPGDKIRYDGMTRSLKKLLSGYERDGFIRTGRPVLCDGNGVLWFPGFPPRDGEKTGKTIYLIYGETKNAGQN